MYTPPCRFKSVRSATKKFYSEYPSALVCTSIWKYNSEQDGIKVDMGRYGYRYYKHCRMVLVSQNLYIFAALLWVDEKKKKKRNPLMWDLNQ